VTPSERTAACRLILRRIRNRYAVFPIAWLALTATAAQNTVTLSVSLREEYNDNFRLTSAPHSNVLATTVSPAARFTYATDTLSASGKAQLNFNRYRGDSELNNNDVLLDGLIKKNFPLDQVTLLTSYVRDSTLASELAQTGVVQVNRQRTRFSLNPEWIGTISPRATWTVGYDFANVTYQESGDADLIDYRFHKGYTTYGYRWTERTKTFVTGGISTLKFDRLGDKTRTLFALAGIEHNFSEVWRSEISFGLRRVRIQDSDDSRSESGWLGQGSLERRFETGLLRAAAARELNPTGLGSLTQTDRVSLSWSDRISPGLSYGIDAAAFRNAFVSGTNDSDNDRYYRIDARISYALSEDWIIDGGLGYARIEPDTGNSARSRSVFFSARYEWSRLLPSR
jgi:hypothetical protein